MQIIKDSEKGEKKIELAEKYDVNPSSVTRIIQNKKSIQEKHKIVTEAGGNSAKRKRYAGTEESALETILLDWFRELRNCNEPVTGSMLKTQAILIYKSIHGNKKFEASSGWVDGFKKRHGIRCLETKGLLTYKCDTS